MDGSKTVSLTLVNCWMELNIVRSKKQTCGMQVSLSNFICLARNSSTTADWGGGGGGGGGVRGEGVGGGEQHDMKEVEVKEVRNIGVHLVI